MRSKLAQTLLRHISKEEFLRPGQRAGVAVSGGADSVALLRLFMELRDELGIVFSVVHFNHKLRGKASDADEKFVVALAEKFGLPLHIGRADVAAKSRREKSNLEDAARRARYDFFARLVEQGIVDCVATAHTEDDQAETVLSHILRGTGLAGLGAIHPRTPHVFRPLLGVRRAELRNYLRARKQTWREDATNKDVSRLRARIRKKLVPLLEKQFQPRVVEHLATLADLARADEAALALLARQRCSTIASHENQVIRIPTAELFGKNENIFAALASRIVRLLAEEIRSKPGQWTAEHVHQVLELARQGEPGKLLQLPGSIEVRRERDALLFSAAKTSTSSNSPQFSYHIDFAAPETRISVPALGCVFRFRVIDWPSSRRDTKGESRSTLDRDRLRQPLVLRNWQPGDRFQPAGRADARKFKRLLSDLQLSSWQRAGWPVLTSGGVLAWARGFPAAAQFAADERTRTGIVISEEQL